MTHMSAEPAVLRLERTIAAPRERVYRAWLDPDLLRRWLAPGTTEVARVEVDARVGGHFRIWHRRGDIEIGGFECEVLELVPPERLVFSWGFVGPDRTDGPMYDSILMITLDEARGGHTTLTLVHERLETLSEALPEVAAKVEPGWVLVLDKLEALVAQ